MRLRVVVPLATLPLLAPMAVAVATPGRAAGSSHVDGGVRATVTAHTVVLANDRIRRSWAIGEDGSVRTIALSDRRTGKTWGGAGPDFTITVNGVKTSPASDWTVTGVTAVAPPHLAGRPASALGAAVVFHYQLAGASLPTLRLDRVVTLHPGSALLEVTSTLHSAGPAARVSAYVLDQVHARGSGLPAEILAFHGGSDWRDDYRQVGHPGAGRFDSEGEVVRFGQAAGYFLVSQRRGGSMSRVGRVGDGTSWVGVDWARDLFDYGPLQTSPPHYNRLDNPAYPVPLRSRTLPPLGSMDLGTAYVGVYSGGGEEAAAAFTSDFVGAQEPRFRRTVGLNSFHPWNHGPGMSDANLRKQVDAAKALGVETFMLDDQWQGGPGGESGDWQWDPERFPDADHNGVPDFVTYLHHHGLSLGLWMSPLEFNGASRTYAAHPDWACAPVGDLTAQVQDDAGLGVWDATNPQFQDYLVGVVHRLVHTVGVREFKFDFMAWVDCGAHDYADYEAAFVDIVHRMQAGNPGVTFELDETNDQRSWPFESAQLGPSWFDNGHLHGSGPVAKLLHDVWTAAPWVPTWSLGVGLYDGTLKAPYDGVPGVDFLFPLAMLTHVTFWSDLTTLSAAQRDETAWWTRWYRRHRSGFGSTVYELTTHDPIDGKSWAAWQLWNGTGGYVLAFRQPGAPTAQKLTFRGLHRGRSYRLSNVRNGRELGVFTGHQLMAGRFVSLPPAASVVLAVRPA
jgi:hypothetical protein